MNIHLSHKAPGPCIKENTQRGSCEVRGTGVRLLPLCREEDLANITLPGGVRPEGEGRGNLQLTDGRYWKKSIDRDSSPLERKGKKCEEKLRRHRLFKLLPLRCTKAKQTMEEV